MNRRRALLTLGAALVACGRREVASGGARVVSIAPSTTEVVFALGAGELLVGRSRHCDHPPDAARLPVVGGYADPSVEAILALAPTLVVGARGPAGPALEQALAARGVTTYFPETESLAQIEAMIAEVGRRIDRSTAAAEMRVRVRAAVRGVEEAVAGRARVRTVMLFDVSPPVAAGPGGFPDELIRRSGGENLITKGGAYPTLGLEHLLALDPEVLLDAGEHDPAGRSGVAARREAPGWSELRALREGRVRALGSTVLRPGPRIGDGLRSLARALHGELPGLASGP